MLCVRSITTISYSCWFSFLMNIPGIVSTFPVFEFIKSLLYPTGALRHSFL
jgi:hypothetical protein